MDSKIAVITGAGRGPGRSMATLKREQGLSNERCTCGPMRPTSTSWKTRLCRPLPDRRSNIQDTTAYRTAKLPLAAP
jgi:hypothetical protein